MSMKKWFMHPLPASGSTPGVSPWMVLPFAILLLAIALGPLFLERWWHRNYPRVAVGLGLFTAGYYLFFLKDGGALLHVAHEYFSFIALIGSLFVTAGGIHIAIRGESRPAVNVGFLLTAAILANVIGTTGASMLLIRPWIRMNHRRIRAFHVVFFIFIVSNVGGALTPIGDPPLFLGFLKGVPFFWVLQNCWLPWLLTIALLLAVFYLLDRQNFRKPAVAVTQSPPEADHWRFEGGHNVLFIAVIIGAVLANGILPPFVPDAIMIAAAAASFLTTSRTIHESNTFSFAPIREVAWLFAGIFATMLPALDYLEKNSAHLGLSTPAQYFWATGALSAFLDNAPTYLTFLAAAMGGQGLSVNDADQVRQFVGSAPALLAAISLGAVFFGACTYIGNGPNFMVKNIAHQLGVQTPGFFGYLLKYAVPILIPIYALVAMWFFSQGRIF